MRRAYAAEYGIKAGIRASDPWPYDFGLQASSPTPMPTRPTVVTLIAGRIRPWIAGALHKRADRSVEQVLFRCPKNIEETFVICSIDRIGKHSSTFPAAQIDKNVMAVTAWLMKSPHYPGPERADMNQTSVLRIAGGSGPPRGPESIVARMKARQCGKLRALRQALIDAGCHSLDQQAAALGLCRSTAWTVVQGQHKASGLSAAIVNRIMESPRLPQSARTVLLEYIQEKAAGVYGHNGEQTDRFCRHLEEKRTTKAPAA
jgi:hypothetical protein